MRLPIAVCLAAAPGRKRRGLNPCAEIHSAGTNGLVYRMGFKRIDDYFLRATNNP